VTRPKSLPKCRPISPKSVRRHESRSNQASSKRPPTSAKSGYIKLGVSWTSIVRARARWKRAPRGARFQRASHCELMLKEASRTRSNAQFETTPSARHSIERTRMVGWPRGLQVILPLSHPRHDEKSDLPWPGSRIRLQARRPRRMISPDVSPRPPGNRLMRAVRI
jgi:hypothetical protein